MDGKKDEFIQKLDELIDLFKQLSDKATKEGVLLKDDPLYSNFELLTSNYNLIKNNLPDELIEEVGGPIQEIITEMVEQLKKEFDAADKETNHTFSEIKEIDARLRKQDLSNEQINELLDLRARLN